MAESGTDRGWAPISVDRPVATFMVVAAVVVFGWVSLAQMPVDLMPELSHPTITVRTAYEGAAPEEVEDAITRPIEEYLGTVEGLTGLSSISRAGSSDVVFRFEWNTDLDLAIQKIRERVAFLTMPDGAESPQILRYDPTLDPILELAVVAESMSASALREYVVDEVERELEELEGVAMVRVTGGDEAVVRVAMDEGRLAAYGISPTEVVTRLQGENVNVAGGRLLEGEVEYLVRTVNEFGGVEELAATVLAVRGDIPVRLRDVARVQEDVRDREVVTRVDGHASVEIAVFKDADANLVAVAEAVRRRIYGATGAASEEPSTATTPGDPNGSGEGSAEGSGAEDAPQSAPAGRALGPGFRRGPDDLASGAPEGVRFEVLTDQSTYIRAAIDEVTNTAFLGGLCAVVVLFVFLRRPYATFVIGMAIPLSVIATFAPLRLLGVSLNIMSLGGIALGIGMLVDNAIVVLESIVRCREEGDDLRSAALRGTREVGGAVTASTLTTVAVFLPIVFVEGVAGQLFGDLGVAVVLSLIASLVFALLFVPMMSVLPARLGRSVGSPRELLQSLLTLSSVATIRRDVAWAGTTGQRDAWRWIYVVPVMLYAFARFLVWVVLEVLTRAIVIVVVGLGIAVGTVVRWIAKAVGALVDVPLRAFAWGLEKLTQVYRAGLRVALNVRWLVLAAAVASLFWALQTWPSLGMQLIPDLSQGVFVAQLQLPVGTRLDETIALVERVEDRLEGHPDIERLAAFVGRDEEDLDASDQGEHTAELTIVVSNAGADAGAEGRAMAAVREAISVEPALQHDLARPSLFSIADPVVVEIRGEELEALAVSAGRVEAAMRGVEGLADVRSSARDGFPEVRVRFDRERLARLGLDARTVAETVRSKVQGEVATELRLDARSVDVDVALDRRDVADLEALRSMVVAFVDDSGAATALPTGANAMGASAMAGLNPGAPAVATGAAPRRAVRLSGVAEISVGRGPAEIRRVDGQRAAVITASTSALDLDGVLSRLSDALGSVPLADGQVVVIAGQSDEMEAAQKSLAFAMLLAVFLVYVVMASTFESLLGPLVILVTIPLALVGVVGALAMLGTPVSVVVLIGVIVLAGIVVNNAIVLIDYVIALRRRGAEKRAAIVEACSLRLRPVLITATTTVLGLLPMAMGLGEGAEIRRPLAWVVISGLAVGTVLTLVVIPLVYDVAARDGALRAPDDESWAR